MFNLYDKGKDNDQEAKRIRIILKVILISITGILVGIIVRSIVGNSYAVMYSEESTIELITISMCLSFMAYTGCIVYYASTRKEENFIISLVYLNLSISCIVETTQGYSGFGVINSIFRTIILVLIFNNKIIFNKKVVTTVLCTVISIINSVVEQKWLYSINDGINTYALAIIIWVIIMCYFIVALFLARKSIDEVDIIYSYVVGSFSILMIRGFCIILDIVIGNGVNSCFLKNTYINLTIIAYLIIVLGVFIQVIVKSNESRILEEELSVFYQLSEKNGTDDIIIYDYKGKIVYANKIVRDKWCKTSKLKDQYRELDKILKNEQGNFQNIMDILEQNEYIKKDVVVEELDIVIELHIQKVFSGNNKKYYIFKFNDITDRVKADKRIRESESVLRNITDTIQDMIIAIDGQGDIVHLNNSAIRCIGNIDYRYNKINFYNLIEDKEQRDIIKSTVDNKVSYTITNLKNEKIFVEGYIRKIRNINKENDIGENVRYLIVAIDVEQKNKYDNLLLEYNNFKKHEKKKNAFFINLSHEFKTPLNVIFSAIQLLNDVGVEDEKCFIELYNKYKNTMKINSLRMSRIINNMIDILRLEANSIHNINQKVNIVELIEDVSIYVRGHSMNKNIDIIFDTEEEYIIVNCDPQKVVRATVNLLANAIKFSENHSTVYVKLTIDNENVNIDVIDNGIGISEDMYESIFNSFSQIDKSLTRQKEGSGIGLSIAKRLIELQGGTILVESKVGEGSKFTIVLEIENVVDYYYEDNKEKYNLDFKEIDTELSDIYEIY